MSRAPVAAVRLAHGRCPPGCPLCPTREDDPAWPEPREVHRIVEEARDRHRGRVELAFFGGDLWSIPRPERTALLDAAETEFRRGRVDGIRVGLAPISVLRAPLPEFRARGVRGIELMSIGSSRRVATLLGARCAPRLAPEAIGRARRARMRTIVSVIPGLPGSTPACDRAGFDAVAAARPDGARVLPALALEGTRLAELWRRGLFHPLSLEDAVAASAQAVTRLRAAGVSIVRVGLQPSADLPGEPEVLAGPAAPDLRLRVETALLRTEVLRALTSQWALGTRAMTLAVDPAVESFLRGPENATLRELRARFRLDELHVVPRPSRGTDRLRVYRGRLDLDGVAAAERPERTAP
jgi:hypothetical protein